MYRDTFSFSRLLSAGLLMILLTVLVISCDKNDKQGPPPTIPIVTTATLSNVNVSAGIATGGGSIVSDGGDTVTQTGIVWSKTNATPTLSDSVIEGVGSNGTFSINITGLDFDNIYYFRAFATNTVGTGYGSVVTLTTSADSVKFTYNGEEVVYGIIISPTTGKKWLDRNLGAKQVATTYNDWQAYGDFFQWGRPDDGHQLIIWTAANAEVGTAGTPVNGTTTTLATSDTPGHSNFIITNRSVGQTDWRDDNNTNRWATNPQGPCPAGWHIPAVSEWQAEVANTAGGGPIGTATSGGITDRASGFSLLKLTAAGLRRDYFNGESGQIFGRVAGFGMYWTTSEETADAGFTRGLRFELGDGYVMWSGDFNANSMSVRCIKNN